MQKTYTLLSQLISSFAIVSFFSLVSCMKETTTTLDDVLEKPTVTTSPATSIASSSATLNGSVNPNGSPTTAWFEYGMSSTLSSYTNTSFESIGSTTSTLNFTQSITSLSSNTTYYYRIAASNSAGTNQGLILSFLAPLSNVTDEWALSTRTDFSNDAFTASLTANLNLTQTNELLEGYSQDVYKITGTFNNFGWIIQRKSDGASYLLQNASGSIVNGGINTSMLSHNLEFYLASSNYHFRGVAPGYETMWGDITVIIDMSAVYETGDGVITLTGTWDAKRN